MSTQQINCNTSISVGEIQLQEGNSNGNNYIGFVSPSLASSYTIKFPGTDGSAGDVFTVDGGGDYSFSAPPSGGINNAQNTSGTGQSIIQTVGASTLTLKSLNVTGGKLSISNNSNDVVVETNEANFATNVLDTQGQIVSYLSGSYTPINPGLSGQILTANGSALPTWDTPGQLIDVSVLQFAVKTVNSGLPYTAISPAGVVASTSSPNAWNTGLQQFNFIKSGYTGVLKTFIIQWQGVSINTTVANTALVVAISIGTPTGVINPVQYRLGYVNTNERRTCGLGYALSTTTSPIIGVSAYRNGTGNINIIAGSQMIIYTYVQ